MDLGPVAELKSLEGLILNDSEVKDLTPLADSLCTDLELVNCQAADLSPIGQMKNLKHLTIRNCDASDFEFLADLKKLTYLDLSGTTFANGSSLVGLEKLKYLDLSNTRLKNHDQLKGLKSLIMISLPWSELSNNAKSELMAILKKWDPRLEKKDIYVRQFGK